VKKPFSLPPSLILFVSIVLFFLSCKKIDEATTLGGDLVPEVDNINTFEASFQTETDNILLDANDTAKLGYGDAVALGTISSDPEFGRTAASVYFQVAPATYGTYPFSAPNPQIDSVVLSLDYVSGYGDTTLPQRVRVYEIAQATGFNDTSYYPLNQPDFETTGAELGSALFTMSQLKDSFSIIRTDTQHVANQLRIRLNNSFGERLARYDTTTGVNGGYHNDTLFKSLFRGFAIKAEDGAGNGLAYFNLSNTDKTKLTVYYKATKDATIDTAEVTFTHSLRYTTGTNTSVGGQANSIKRQIGGNWETYLNNTVAQDDKLYIQSSPGSAATIKVPGLDTFQNKVIHRAELVVTRLPSTFDNWFAAPEQLFTDRIKSETGKDSAFHFQEFVALNTSTQTWGFSLASLGGALRTDNTYRFNITTTVQDIITNKKPNLPLRIYAPFDTRPFGLQNGTYVPTFVSTIPYPAYGRVVLAGGNYAETGKQLRLRIIYSNL